MMGVDSLIAGVLAFAAAALAISVVVILVVTVKEVLGAVETPSKNKNRKYRTTKKRGE